MKLISIFYYRVLTILSLPIFLIIEFSIFLFMKVYVVVCDTFFNHYIKNKDR